MTSSTVATPVCLKTSAADPGILLEAGTNELEILVFRVGDYPYGVNVAKVREVRRLDKVTFLPGMPDAIDGVVRIRDAVVPSVDLHKYLWGSRKSVSDVDEHLVLLEFNNRMIAFRVQRIERVFRVSWQEIQPMPRCSSDHVPVTGLVLIDGRIIPLLDFESIGATLGVSGSTEVEKDLDSLRSEDAPPCPLVFVDDSQLIRRMMTDALTQVGYDEIQAFADGQEAWEYLDQLARQHTPETVRQSVAAVITDIEMPRMDGFNLTKRVREHAVLKDLPVILFSSLVSKDNEKKGRQVGATAQVSKPKWNDLTTTLAEVITEVVA